MSTIRRPIRVIFSAVAICTLTVAAPHDVRGASSTPANPDTPAAAAFGGWLAAFNSGNDAAYRAFVRARFPSNVKALSDNARFRRMTGGFDLRKVEAPAPPGTFVALLQERDSDQFARARLTLDPKVPGRIATIDVMAIPRPAAFPLPHLRVPALVAALKEKLQRDAAAGRFSGSALFAVDGAAIFSQAYGLADRTTRAPNTPQTRFRIGSMNKMFTAVATLQLAEAGKIRLDAPLATYLPDYPNKHLAATVTIHELLTHTGGTRDIFGPQFDAHRTSLRTLADYEKLYGSRDVAFTPGSRWAYSNYGFILLGLVIEAVSGENYYDYVRKHVYEPAGMSRTGSEPESVAVADRSIGYTGDGRGGVMSNADTLPDRGTSAGGGYSTTLDLLKFANALDAHVFLNATSTELLTTGKVATPRAGRRYAYGFGDDIVNGTRCIGHNGGAPGMNGALAICANHRYVVVVLANQDPPAADRIANFITNRLPLRP